jgi:phage shock protein E
MRVIGHREVARLLEAGAQLIDVLPAHEYQSAHIRGAIHLPLHRVIRDAPKTLDPARPVILYCRDCL